jgi:hypothetical protein
VLWWQRTDSHLSSPNREPVERQLVRHGCDVAWPIEHSSVGLEGGVAHSGAVTFLFRGRPHVLGVLRDVTAEVEATGSSSSA